ncbi:hypothetical protein ACEZHJ_14445 [Arhodomonas sp. KWT2]|uniref:hypothetical protein n=1 Tax=unclassified Arhodomonas TaxID=2621637 RepID=UPI0013D19A19|nr:hypothetical protein [Arhodomonas sp. KWT]
MRGCGITRATALAVLLATGTGIAAPGTGTRHCLLVDPAAAAAVPPQVLFSQMGRPDAGDTLRIVVGADRVTDVTLSPRPGLRTAELLAGARGLASAGSAADGGTAWRPSPARCLGDGMPTRVVVAGRLTATPAPEKVAAGTLADVTLLSLPVGDDAGDETGLDAWRKAWPAATPVRLMPLAGPELPATEESSDDG